MRLDHRLVLTDHGDGQYSLTNMISNEVVCRTDDYDDILKRYRELQKELDAQHGAN